MSKVRVRKDGTKVTTPAWLIIPGVLLGWTIVGVVIWAGAVDRGWSLLVLIAVILCLGGVCVRLLYMFEKVERNDRTAFGAARFASDRDDAARAGLERN